LASEYRDRLFERQEALTPLVSTKVIAGEGTNLGRHGAVIKIVAGQINIPA
jgi:hypothetical protein